MTCLSLKLMDRKATLAVKNKSAPLVTQETNEYVPIVVFSRVTPPVPLSILRLRPP